jgi:putative GTP pyrophosphokinase
MSKPVNINSLEKEHELLFPKCESFCKEVSRQIQHIIEKEKIQLAVPIQFRAKTFISISDKIKQGRFNIKKTILELQDLAGIRIITLFKRDAIRVVELINSQFEVLIQYNTEDKLQESEFGYSSIHIVGKLKESWLDIPSFSEFKNLKFETQVRTLSQHSWAEASNIFQYKKADNVPKPLKRSISRISALLETVDLEFERLLEDRDSYKEEIKHQNRGDLVLNVDLLEEILNKKLPADHKTEEEDYSKLLDNLNVLDYKTVNNLSELIDNYLTETLKENKRVSDGFKQLYNENPEVMQFEKYHIRDGGIKKVLNGIYFTHTGIVRKMLDLKFGKPWNEVYKEKKKNVS